MCCNGVMSCRGFMSRLHHDVTTAKNPDPPNLTFGYHQSGTNRAYFGSSGNVWDHAVRPTLTLPRVLEGESFGGGLFSRGTARWAPVAALSLCVRGSETHGSASCGSATTVPSRPCEGWQQQTHACTSLRPLRESQRTRRPIKTGGTGPLRSGQTETSVWMTSETGGSP